MPLTVLSNKNIQHLLLDLRQDDLQEMMELLRESLDEYSQSKSAHGCASRNQPEATAVQAHGKITMFMPATSSTGLGMKVITQATPSSSDESVNSMSAGNPQGAVLILSPESKPIGIINASEFTAFRTALTSSLLLVHRQRVRTLTVFGTGKQAFWHVRLALSLHGHTIKNVHFIARDWSDNAHNILATFYGYNHLVREREGWLHTEFGVLTQFYEEYPRLVKQFVRDADVLYCTTPSTEPLFDHHILTENQGRLKGRLIIAVGSYKPDMIEIPPEIIHQAVKRHGAGHHLHKHVEEGLCVVVDTVACLENTGELSRTGLSQKEVVELGELVMLERLTPSPDESNVSYPSDNSSRSSMEGLTLGSRRSTFASSLSSFGKSDSDEKHSLAHLFPHHLPHHLPSIFHLKGPRRHSQESLTLKKSTSNEKPGPNPIQKSPSIEKEKENIEKSSTRSIRAESISTGTMSTTSPLSITKFDRHGNMQLQRYSPPELSTSPTSSLSLSSMASIATLLPTAILPKKIRKAQTTEQNELSRWLTKGNVIYKSMGVGLVDLVVGGELIRRAREEGVGVTIQRF